MAKLKTGRVVKYASATHATATGMSGLQKLDGDPASVDFRDRERGPPTLGLRLGRGEFYETVD